MSLEVQPVSTRTFSQIPVELPGALAGGFTVDHDRVTVVVRGATERMGNLTADSVHVFLDPSRGSTPGRAPLRVLVPPGFTGTAHPDSVTLVRRGNV